MWSWTGPFSSLDLSFLVYKMRILNWISCSQPRWLDSMLSVGMLLTSTRLHSLHCPSLSSGPDYKNLGLFLEGCHGVNNTIGRCAGRDGKAKSLPPLYQVISMGLSGPDCLCVGPVQSSIIDPGRQTQVNGVREASPHPLFPSVPEDRQSRKTCC